MDRIDGDCLFVEDVCEFPGCGATVTYDFFVPWGKLEYFVSQQICEKCLHTTMKSLSKAVIVQLIKACEARQAAEEQETGLFGEALSSPETTLSELQEWAVNALGEPIDSKRLNEIWTILKAKQEAWADCTQCELGPLLEATLDLLADAVVRTLPSYSRKDS